ncbi:hypothetical protein [Agromyces subbeticus]|uniref:hypothetical protein n=1 Tax=Agromyces subbeticus TaxID=293890 RepID=UPI0003B4E5D7|nr:hypothetical protein [Agromyces subbeticus]
MSISNHTTRSTWRTVVAVATSVAVVLGSQLLPLALHGGLRLDRMRTFFSFDQWGYLAIVRNVADGLFSDVEPDTETGSNFYPHGYYTLLGLVARATGIPSIVAWNVVGLLVLGSLVAVLATVLVRFGGRVRYAFLAPVPFLIGTYAWVWADDWRVPLESHAVLWAPFAVLHSGNGEMAGLSAAGAALLCLIAVWFRPTARGWRISVTIGSAAVLGALANVQTYSFLTGVYLAAFVAASWAIVARRQWIVAGVSAALIPVVFVLGPVVHDAGGQLPTLVFGLLPAIPGLVLVVITSRGLVAIAGLVAVLAASPQVVRTLVGISSGDPFLSYRVDSNSNLGVPFWLILGAGIVMWGALAAILVAGILLRKPVWSAYAVGGGSAWLLLSLNDRWGANAEPYRMWIDVFALLSITVLPVMVDIARGIRSGLRQSPQARSFRWWSVGATVLIAALAAGSSVDYVRFVADSAVHQVEDSLTAQDRAAAELVLATDADRTGELIATDPCIVPMYLKVNSGAPIAFFHMGMAWPERHDPLGDVVVLRNAGEFPVEEARAGGVGWVVTESSCDWEQRYTSDLDYVDSIAVTESSTVTLWRLRSQADAAD